MLLLRFQAPEDDVDRIIAAVATVAPLAMGKYDNNAYQSAGGIERYRPLEGAAAGAETEIRRRPGVVEVSFQLPADRDLLERVVETIFRSTAIREPFIAVEPVLVGRSRGWTTSRIPIVGGTRPVIGNSRRRGLAHESAVAAVSPRLIPGDRFGDRLEHGRLFTRLIPLDSWTLLFVGAACSRRSACLLYMSATQGKAVCGSSRVG